MCNLIAANHDTVTVDVSFRHSFRCVHGFDVNQLQLSNPRNNIGSTMFKNLEKFNTIEPTQLVRIFESFKSDKCPEDFTEGSLSHFVEELDVFLSCCRRISDSWKNAVPYTSNDVQIFDAFMNAFEKGVIDPMSLPTICRQVGSGIKFSEFSEISVPNDKFVDLSMAPKQEMGYVVGATKDYLASLWEPFYGLAKSRIPKGLEVQFYVTVPVSQADDCKQMLEGFDDVSLVPVGQIPEAVLRTDTHSYRSSTRFYALSSLIKREHCSHYILTDLDALVPKEFDYSFPNAYKNMFLRFWNPEYPFHWRNVSAGFMYIRQSANAMEFADNLNRALNTYQLTKTMDLCGDQIALDTAMREQTSGVPAAKMNFKLDSWYGSLPEKRTTMMEQLKAVTR